MSQTSEDITLYKCRLCPDKIFTAEERGLHRVEHRSSSSKHKLNKSISRNETSNPKSKVEKSTTNLELPIPGQSGGKISISITISVTTDAPEDESNSESDEDDATPSKIKKSFKGKMKTTRTPSTNPGPSSGQSRANVSKTQSPSLQEYIGHEPTPRKKLATRTGNFPMPTTGPPTQTSYSRTSRKSASKRKIVKNTSNLASRKFDRGGFHRPAYGQLATYAFPAKDKPSLQRVRESSPSTITLGEMTLSKSAKPPARVDLAILHPKYRTFYIGNGKVTPRATQNGRVTPRATQNGRVTPRATKNVKSYSTRSLRSANKSK